MKQVKMEDVHTGDYLLIDDRPHIVHRKLMVEDRVELSYYRSTPGGSDSFVRFPGGDNSGTINDHRATVIKVYTP